MLNSRSDAIYVTELVDVNKNGSTACRLALSSSDDNQANLSTSHTSMEESAILEDNARIPNDTWGGQRNTQYYPDDVTYIIYDMDGTRSTSYRPPVSSGGGDDAVRSASRAGMEESPARLESYVKIPNDTWGGQRHTQYYPADVTFTMYGHTDMTRNGSTGYRPPVCSSGGDGAMPSTSRAGMEGASASLEKNERCATGTEENEQQESCGVCGVCGKVYTRMHALQRHATDNYGVESYICEACCLPSVKITKVLRHCHKSTRRKVYNCDTCGKSFKQSWSLKVHQRTHTGIKPYNCETCGKSFAQLNNLNTHKRTHTGVRPYKCETCGRPFKQLGHLNVHELTHTREKTHVCPTCMKSFHSKHILKEHFNLHTGAKPFVCEICDKSFPYRSSLRRHSLRHADNSPNQSAHCGARFAKRETPDGHKCEMVTCYLCGDSIRDDIQLVTHLVTHIGAQP